MFKELVKNSGLFDAMKDIIVAGDDIDRMIIPIDPSTYTTPDGSSGWGFDAIGGDFKYFKYNDFNSCVAAYEKCPPVSAIINRKAQLFINGKVWVVDEDEEESKGSIATKVRSLLSKPNPLQNRRSFLSQLYVYFQTFGFAIVLPIKPYGSPNLSATSLWNIPANWIDIDATQEKFTREGGGVLKTLVINFNGQRLPIDLSELIIIRDSTPSFHNITFPMSKLLALEMPINNVIGSFESRNTIMNYRGALGILSQDPGKGQFMATPMDDDQKKQLHADFRKYGLRKKQFQVILTTASLKWQQMGYSMREMMLHEEAVESTKNICQNTNFPPFILGLADTTFNNMNAAEKSVYQNATIPDGENIFEQLTAAFSLESFRLRLIITYDHIDVLQENKKEAAEARKALNEALKMEFENGLITLDDWLVELGRDPLPEGQGDVRASDVANSNTPLAVVIGVGGVQSIIETVTAPGLSPEARQAVLEIVFGLSPEDAKRMSKPSQNGTTQGQESGQASQQAA